tara:strand:- start:2314 stop:4917 length:2604 start_codon:yes stop_codon:yes gene_type:complete
MTNVKKNKMKGNKLKSTFRKKNKNLRTSSIKNNKSKYKKNNNRKKTNINVHVKIGGGKNGLSTKQLKISKLYSKSNNSKSSKEKLDVEPETVSTNNLDKLNTEERKEQLELMIKLINNVDDFNSITINTNDNVSELVKKVKSDVWDKMNEDIQNYFVKNKLDLNKHYSQEPINPYIIAKELRSIYQEDKPDEKMYYGLNKQAKLNLQEFLYKLVGKDADGIIPTSFDPNNENHKLALNMLSLITDKYDFKLKKHKSCTVEHNINVLAEFVNALNKMDTGKENVGWKNVNESFLIVYEGFLPEIKQYLNKYEFNYEKINKMKHKMSGKPYNPKEKIDEAKKSYIKIFSPIWRDKQKYVKRKSKLIDVFDDLQNNIKDEEGDDDCKGKISAAIDNLIKTLDDKFKEKAPLPDSDKAAKDDLSNMMTENVLNNAEDVVLKKDVAVLHLNTLKQFIIDVLKLRTKKEKMLESVDKKFNKLPKQIKEKFVEDGFAYENLYKSKSVGIMKSGKTKKAEKIYNSFKEIYIDDSDNIESLINDFKNSAEKVEEEKVQEKEEEKGEKTEKSEIETQTEDHSNPETSVETDSTPDSNPNTETETTSEETESHKKHHKIREDIDGNPLPKLKEDEHYVKHHSEKHGKKYYSIEKYDSNKPYKNKDGKDLPKLKKGQHYIHHHDGTYSIENYKIKAGGGKNDDLDKEIEEIKATIVEIVKKEQQITGNKSSSASESSSVKPEVIGEPISTASASENDLVEAVHGVEDAVRNKNKKSLMSSMMNKMSDETPTKQVDCPPPPDMKSITITAPAGYNLSTEGGPDMNNKISGMKAVLSNKKASAPPQEGGKKSKKQFRRFKLRKRTRRINRQKKNVRKNLNY